MKIKGTSTSANEREFMVEQVIDERRRVSVGRRAVQRRLRGHLVNALKEAEDAGSRLEFALQTIADLQPDFTIDDASVHRAAEDLARPPRAEPGEAGLSTWR